MMPQANSPKGEPILIIGGGVFGLTTALELSKRGYTHITVLDRYNIPVPDGSSVDISRIIRIEYGNELYARMAREALKLWNTTYKRHFYPSGYAMLAEKNGNMEYFETTQQMNDKLGDNEAVTATAAELRSMYRTFPANMDGLAAYVNPKDGWADAAASIRQLSEECSQRGVNFATGPSATVTSLVIQDGQVKGVRVAQGEPRLASKVILSTGAWSNHLIRLDHASTASGQSVGFIQLTPEEAQSLQGMPVIQNWSTGLFVFPPFPGTNVLKVVRHGYGFASTVLAEQGQHVISSPKLHSNNATSGYLPDDASDGLRDGLRQLVPQFADRPWLTRRMCWYSDTPEGDFIVDWHPQVNGLFLATGGAGQ